MTLRDDQTVTIRRWGRVWNSIGYIPESVRLFTSRVDGCLTHITRAVVIDDEMGREIWVAWCSMWSGPRWAISVDPKHEVFACARCFKKAEAAGADTYKMIPATGCEVHNGRQFGARSVVLGEEQ